MNKLRRLFLQATGLTATAIAAKEVAAHHTDTHFDERSTHQLVYQCNKADDNYFRHILFSAGEMIRTYGDDVEVVITCFGPGLHLVLKKPKRPVAAEHQTRVRSLIEYGVGFHACGNTMKSLKVGDKDLIDKVKAVPVGADDLMRLQQKGFAYISW